MPATAGSDATLRFDSPASVLRGSAIVDVRNVLSADDVRMTGPTSVGVGRR